MSALVLSWKCASEQTVFNNRLVEHCPVDRWDRDNKTKHISTLNDCQAWWGKGDYLGLFWSHKPRVHCYTEEFIDDSVTAKYFKVRCETICPIAKALLKLGPTIAQWCQAAKEWLEKKRIKVLKWFRKSPDLNLKMLWQDLKRTRHELKQRCKEMRAIPPKSCERLSHRKWFL